MYLLVLGRGKGDGSLGFRERKGGWIPWFQGEERGMDPLVSGRGKGYVSLGFSERKEMGSFRERTGDVTRGGEGRGCL
jgi:hypothetical protein